MDFHKVSVVQHADRVIYAWQFIRKDCVQELTVIIILSVYIFVYIIANNKKMTSDFKLVFLLRARGDRKRVRQGESKEKNVSMTLHARWRLFFYFFFFAFEIHVCEYYFNTEMRMRKLSVHEKHIRVVNDMPRVSAFFICRQLKVATAYLILLDASIASDSFGCIRDVICQLSLCTFSFLFTCMSFLCFCSLIMQGYLVLTIRVIPSFYKLICWFSKSITI